MPLQDVVTTLASYAPLLLGLSLAALLMTAVVLRRRGAQNRRMSAALNNMSQGLSMFDSQHRLVVWNKNYETMYKLGPTIRRGCGLAELLQARHAAGTLPMDPKKYERDLRSALDAG